MPSTSATTHSRDRIGCFFKENDEIIQLDSAGYQPIDDLMYVQYQRRNSFGLDLSTKIYRIFQRLHYENDKACGILTLPRVDATLWDSKFENPLADVTQTDHLTGEPIALGTLVNRYYALCWTSRRDATKEDWINFSHGKAAVRIETTIGKLLDRVMCRSDPTFMHRSWVIDVDYQSVDAIMAMQTSEHVLSRLESTGSLLALSAATVSTSYSDEEEVRFLYDDGIQPRPEVSGNDRVISLPFQWAGFVDHIQYRP